LEQSTSTGPEKPTVGVPKEPTACVTQASLMQREPGDRRTRDDSPPEWRHGLRVLRYLLLDVPHTCDTVAVERERSREFSKHSNASPRATQLGDDFNIDDCYSRPHDVALGDLHPVFMLRE
jgi:hypothetical protein